MGIVKISNLLENPTVKLMLFLLDRREARYSEMLKYLGSRGTLTLTLKELEQDGLIARKVITNVRPAQAYYSLTERGLKIAKLFVEIRDSLAGKG